MVISDSVANVLLLFEDSVQSLDLAQYLLTLGYRCLAVRRADVEFDWLLRQPIDLMVLEAGMLNTSELERLRAEVQGYLPLILICPLIDDAVLDAYSNVHVDGFLTTPVNPRLLQSKIKSALRVRELYRQQIEQRNLLLEYRQQSDLEQEVAAKIYSAVLERNLLQTEAVRYVMPPHALFNGDLLLVEKTPDNQLYLLLGDFTGRGLSASIGALQVADIFYGMTRKGFSLLDVVQAINAKLHKVLPVQLFLAATVAAFYPDSKNLSLVTCGLPEHFILNKSDGSFREVASKNVPLGILEYIDPVVQHFNVQTQHCLYMMTDGVFGAENSQGEAFDVERIIKLIKTDPDDGIAAIQSRLLKHSQNANRKDDIAWVELTCDVDHAGLGNLPKRLNNRFAKAINWNSMMEFDIAALRAVNPIPVLVNTVIDIQGLQHYREAIFVIICELFANALDHGLLELNSQLKATADGFSEFYRLRDERLQHLKSGRIKLSFRHRAFDHGGRLTITVSDSGNGFDWKSVRQRPSENESFCGRGLKLVESLCTSLRFYGKGNRVEAVFEWYI